MCYSFFWNRLNIFLGKLNCTCCCCWLCLQAWSKLLSPVSEDLPRSINLFMAVPTIYAKLIENYDERVNSGPDSNHTQDYIKTTCSSKIRCFTYQWLLVIIWVFCSWIMTIGETLQAGRAAFHSQNSGVAINGNHSQQLFCIAVTERAVLPPGEYWWITTTVNA